MLAVDVGVRSSENLMPRTTEEGVTSRNLPEHLHGQGVHELDARAHGSTILEVGTDAIPHDIVTDACGVEVEGSRRVEDVDRVERIDVNVLLNHRVILSEGEHPQVRCGPNHLGVKVLVCDVDASENLESLLKQQVDNARQNDVLVRNGGISQIQIRNVHTSSGKANAEVRDVHDNVRGKDEPSLLVITIDEDAVVFQHHGLLDRQAEARNVDSYVLRARRCVARARGRVIHAMDPGSGHVAPTVQSSKANILRYFVVRVFVSVVISSLTKSTVGESVRSRGWFSMFPIPCAEAYQNEGTQQEDERSHRQNRVGQVCKKTVGKVKERGLLKG